MKAIMAPFGAWFALLMAALTTTFGNILGGGAAAASAAGAGVTGSADYVRRCMDSGFDPWQLACSTCSLLPESVRDRCLSCCESYKTTEKKRARKYGAAILIDTGFPPSVRDFLNEDHDNVVKQKRGLQVVQSGGGGGGFFPAEPSSILWFDGVPSGQDDVPAEAMTLDGLSRDDIREMLLALLPDAAA